MSRMKVHKSSDELQDIIEGYKTLTETQRQEIFELKKLHLRMKKTKISCKVIKK